MKPTRSSKLILPVLLMVSWAQFASAFYDPAVQRWINRDPIGEKGGNNLFQFTSNSPVNRVDSWGLWGYGNWCGPTRSGQGGAAIDDVDRACEKHDNCLATWVEALTPCRIFICNRVFCAKVAAADCSTSPNSSACQSAKQDILTACLLITYVPPFNLFL